MTMKKILPVILFYSIFYKSTIAIDTIAPNQALQDNGETLVSAGKTFEMGFFSPLTSTKRYIGIWFKNIPQQTVIWVANKNNPLTDSSGIFLTITADGNLLIINNPLNIIIWCSNSSTNMVTNPTLQLLNTGNLVVLNDSGSTDNNQRSRNYIWQSFDHPCDTLIPGMKLGWNLRTGQNWYLTSWKSSENPSDGDYSYELDPRGLPQLVLRKGSSEVKYRSGPWDGVRFGGDPIPKGNAVFNPIFVFDTNNVYYSFEDNGNNMVSRFVVNQSGLLQHFSWSERRGAWVDILTLQGDSCDEYGVCGPNGICNVDMPSVCKCPDGFVPKLPQDWEAMDWSGGCVKKVPLNCSEDEGFRKFLGLKLPDTSYFLVNRTVVDSEECEDACLRNCSCVAYAKTHICGCVVWFGDLLDIREYSEGGQDLYIRMAASELGSHKEDQRTVMIVSVVAAAASGVLLLGLISWYVIRKRTAERREAQRLNSPPQYYNHDIMEENLELPAFDLVTVSTATNNFSFTNKIGEGGFGPVYKGTLSTGQEIAVKRLSKDSGQGLKELKNEIILIAKLQHRNLVRLLGCCIHGEERMLIYEYMPNKSLDLFIFNQTRGTSIGWRKRFDITVGIARGLLYLHRDSRLRIIHRDVKASNILLDQEMNPKISDFGLARIFRADQTMAETNRIIGTYGYMSPEYAIDGLFSVKSDVFSFGVLVLEIVSGRKNRGFNHPEHDLNLLGHAWKLWNEGRPMELMDAVMENPVPTSEVLRCIQVGLLCVQQRPEDRPTMSYALLMLDTENSVLPQPKQPGFYTERVSCDTDLSSTGKKTYTANEVTITMLQGR